MIVGATESGVASDDFSLVTSSCEVSGVSSCCALSLQENQERYERKYTIIKTLWDTNDKFSCYLSGLSVSSLPVSCSFSSFSLFVLSFSSPCLWVCVWLNKISSSGPADVCCKRNPGCNIRLTFYSILNIVMVLVLPWVMAEEELSFSFSSELLIVVSRRSWNLSFPLQLLQIKVCFVFQNLKYSESPHSSLTTSWLKFGDHQISHQLTLHKSQELLYRFLHVEFCQPWWDCTIFCLSTSWTHIVALPCQTIANSRVNSYNFHYSNCRWSNLTHETLAVNLHANSSNFHQILCKPSLATSTAYKQSLTCQISCKLSLVDSHQLPMPTLAFQLLSTLLLVRSALEYAQLTI